ncbi:hypothetical protein ABZ470_00510 [Streptosporangium sp. NPDC020072]|uniref:hypothetical protein n=1 Tax=Streptosporangium sp. NPDC020072 TaxID=3154788 RepID=UPI00342EC75E
MSHQHEPQTVDFLIILTASIPIYNGSQQFTIARTLAVGPRSTREGLLSWALDQLPEDTAGRANILFFSAEPNALPGVTG